MRPFSILILISRFSLVQAGPVQFINHSLTLLPRPNASLAQESHLKLPNVATIFGFKDMEYTVELILGGSDLWIDTQAVHPKTITQHLSSKGSIEFSNGELVQARGNLGTIDIAPATLAGHKVSNQSFLSTQSQSHLQKENGVLGIGPQFGSVIRRNSSCDDRSESIPLIDHIFSQSSSLKSLADPVITLSLPRMEGNGTFSIMDPELQKRFQKLPKVPVVIAPNKINQKWTTRIDGFNLARSTYSWVPLSSAISIYAHFNGSYDKKNNLFWVPCMTEVTVNIRIHNQTLSMHPLDITIDVGEPLCIGTFMPITPAHMTFLDVDVILGIHY
ncbi:hypothetical protein M422DRAFT_45957 [Sphaerobolus stellatus SS14]|uniref:Unplaced genomic scaffold SPHSTscaffold_29, whole genome shotgun sequence n=1 Tax=Sphaerobolus stellatus (strain SS14) TaxID=990650 RepID=A0A0C9W5Q5_SPHS4|nr:hypothetical protein M422DRAFT_45957 [Sphaerobolus stellatus SS14]